MTDQKAENLLNLALDTAQQERERSLNLDTGYDERTNTWDVIVKYSGDISALKNIGARVVPLLNNFAIVTVAQEDIERLLDFPQVEYVEKPKRLFFAVNEGRRASCINAVQVQPFNLTGRGILVAVIDSGVDIYHPDFRNEDGTTRIAALWDQTDKTEGIRPPEGYFLGGLYTAAMINALLSRPEPAVPLGDVLRVPGADISGHGTSVLGIAAGNGRASNGLYKGVAPESTILAVKLGSPKPDGFPRTTELMQAINFVIETAIAMAMPVALNISFGNSYGAHTGASLLESYINDMANVWKNNIVIGAGNEGSAAGHTSGRIAEGSVQAISLAVSPYETVLNIQIWKNYYDTADIEIVAPGGTVIGPISPSIGPSRFQAEGTMLLVYYGEPSPYAMDQEIYIDFIPEGTYIAEGLWEIRLIGRRIINGNYQMWLPGHAVLNPGTRFLYPNPELTLTIPSTAFKAITVGAYNSRTEAYADFSGRGYPGAVRWIKPEIAAPGVDIHTAFPGGGYHDVTGTSFATPFVTGSCALLMEYGIVRGNDPFLYGEKVKAYLISGARRLPGFDEWPNNQIGYGALCLRNSIPE